MADTSQDAFIHQQYANDPRFVNFSQWGPIQKDEIIQQSDLDAEFGHIPDGSLVEFRISCRGLQDLDSLTKSDPVALATENRFVRLNSAFDKLLGHTEVIKNELSPTFYTPLYTRLRKIDITKHVLRFWLLDIDRPNEPITSLVSHEFVRNPTHTRPTYHNTTPCTSTYSTMHINIHQQRPHQEHSPSSSPSSSSSSS